MRFWRRGGDRSAAVQGRFQSGGLSLAFETMGQGVPVVLVHGFASNLATNWKTPGIMMALADAGLQAAAFDGRGHGQSDRPNTPGSYSLDAMAADVEAFIAHLGLERPALVGYSMGARIVMRLLTARPSPARAAVLGGVGDGVFALSRSSSERIAEALLAKDVGQIGDKIARRFRLFAESQGNDLRTLAQCIREVMEPIDPLTLSTIGVPVLILAGAEDDQIADPEALARRIPGARAQIIPSRNHMTIIGDGRFRQAIVSFLDEAG